MQFEAVSRTGAVYWQFDAGGDPPPPPPPPPPTGAALDFVLPVRAGASAFVYDGFAGFIAPPPPPATQKVTIRLVDAAVGGNPLPNLTAIQWGWWDNANDESETWGTPPTASGTTESTNSSGVIQIEAASSKTSGQAVLIKLYKHGPNPRKFTGLLPID